MKKEKLIELIKENEEVKLALIETLENEFYLKEKIENDIEIIKKDSDQEIQLKEEREKIKEMGKMINKLKELLGISEKKNEKQSSSITKKDNELKLLEKEKDKLNKEIIFVQNKLKEKKEELVQVESKNNNLSNKVSFYRESFEEDLRTYELYTQLLDNTKTSLKGIFKDDTLKGFIACGIQDRNISSLWDYIKDEIREEKNADIPKLKSIFNFLFERYQMAYPIFNLQEVEEGNIFDDFKYIRHNSSKEVSGTISEVVFKGWINNKTNKVIKKSIVKMGEIKI